MDGQRVGFPIAQQFHHFALFQQRRKHEMRHLHDAQARQAGGRVGVRVVQGDMAGHGDLDALARAREIPVEGLARLGGEEIHAPVLRQVVRVLRRAVPRQVVGRGAGNEMQHADAARDQVQIAQFAAAHGAVDAFLDQVDGAVAATEFQRDIGVAGKEVGQGGDDQFAGQGRGRIHAQPSAGTQARARQRFFGLAHVGQDAHAAFVIRGAVGGDADVARGAVEQLDRQAAFQRLDQGRDGGFRQLHVFRRAREAARIDDLDEDFHGLQLVHLISYHFLNDYSES